MGTPLRQSKRLGGQGLVSAYIEHVGKREPIRRNLPPLANPSPLHASFLVAQSCVLLFAGNDRPADHMLRDVRDTMRPVTEEENGGFDETSSRNRHLFHLAVMLLERHDQIGAAQTFQASTHRRAVEELRQITPPRPKGNRRHHEVLGGKLVGRRSELLLAALITRETIGTLAIQALVHHDQGARQAGNYDLILVGASEKLEGSPTVGNHQLKNGCLDFCDGRESKERGQAAREKYRTDIALVSGHCDVHQGEPGIMAQWLDYELNERATPEVIAKLDARTDSLRASLINPEPWRIGLVRTGGARVS